MQVHGVVQQVGIAQKLNFLHCTIYVQFPKRDGCYHHGMTTPNYIVVLNIGL